MIRILLAALLAALATAASAQSGSNVRQSGSITPTQVPYWVGQGVIGGGVTANDSPVTTFGVTSNSEAGLCVSSGRSTAAGRQQLCLGTPLNDNAIISLQNYGTATAQDLTFRINGTDIVLPTGGGTIPTVTPPYFTNQPICAQADDGALKGCSTGATNAIPYWASATVQGAISAAANSVLVTNGSNVPSLSTTLPSAVQANITETGTVASGVWNGTAVTVPFGGTGGTSFTANGVLIANGTSAFIVATTSSVGLCLISNGSGSPPAFASCSSGSGSAGGSNTQVQFNNASALAGSANLTWSSPALTIGVDATTTGSLVLANGSVGGQSVTVRNNAATSAYNFNLPATAGTSGQPLISGGGGATAMQFATLGISGGGTNCTSASGTCLDNITSFSSTGYINRTGAGTYAFSSIIGMANGGTGEALTPVNTALVYTDANSMEVSAGAFISGGQLTLGVSSSALGSLRLSGNTSGLVTIAPAAAAGTWTLTLPTNDGASGEVLTTDGNGVTSWTAVAGTGTVTSVAAGTGMSFTTITTTGSVEIDKSDAGGLAAGTSNKVVTSDIAVSATAFSALTPGATVTPDLNTAYNFTLTPDQNFTLANPSNVTGKIGRSYCIVVTNDATPRTITFDTNYYAPGGDSTIALTASAGAVDQLCFLVVTTSRIHVTITKNYTNS